MFALAARSLGYRVVVLDPDAGAPASAVADEHIVADFDDPAGLDRLARCAAVTTEFENVPAAALTRLSAACPVRPPPTAVALTQDRIREKAFVREVGLSSVPYVVLRAGDDYAQAWSQVGGEAILKRAALGYDGKGQRVVDSAEALAAAHAELDHADCVLERRVALAAECSVVLARAQDGACVCFDVAQNTHRDGILDTSIVPARLPAGQAEAARAQAVRLAEALEYVGVLAVEFFVTEQDELLVNELAPRPHNSGHYTIDACVTSQFEQQLRTLCGLPLGETRAHSAAVMVNLLGDLWAEGEPDWTRVLAEPCAKLHLYGKDRARPGRKMGHFTILHPDRDEALARARRLIAALRAP
jgi:5-(carboxyamino)imidazole ribonucleotide synthase